MKIIEDIGELVRNVIEAFKKGFNKDGKNN